jgi:prepilin-type N-terminal cleavage/methylation domain-containing protein
VRLNHERLRRARGDDGFTLIEMVMTVAIMGIVSAALLGVVLQYAKTTSDTSARLNESTDEQFVSTYWQNDVSSLGRRSLAVATATFSTDQSVFVGSAGPGGCGSATGSVVVAFAWNEFEAGTTAPADPWASTPQRVAYVTVPNGSRFLLQRVRCKNGVAGAPQTVAHNLTGPPTIACNIPNCGSASLPNRVSMTFTVKDAANATSQGYTTTVSADRRQG